MRTSDFIMVLPGTLWQVPLIKYLKKLGYKIVVVHPYEGAPAFQYADEVEFADILDKEMCLEIAKKWNVCAVMSDECDIATPTLAYISNALGLPSQGEGIASLFTNKLKMRELCKKNFLPYPDYKLCYTIEEALEFYRKLNHKMIIKPIDSSSSRGVYTIENELDLISLFDKSIGYSHHIKAVICEKFISGAEFSVDGIKLPDGHISLAISIKTQFPYNANLDNKLIFTYNSENYDYDLLRDVNNRLVDMTSLPFGFTHAEYRCENGIFYLLEIGARGGGNLISSHIVPALTGIDNYSILVDQFVHGSTNKKIDTSLIDKNKAAALVYFDTTESGGVVKSIEGADLLKNNVNILYYQFNFKVGDKISRPTDGGNRIGFYLACCNDKNELDNLISEINRTVKIVYME